MEDTQIVDLYLLRDEAAILQTKEKYGKRLYALAYGIVKDAQSAEECENDAYMAAWSSIPPHGAVFLRMSREVIFTPSWRESPDTPP